MTCFIIAALDEPKGLDVKDELEEYYGTEIRHGRLYPNLDTLVNKELVEKGEHDLRTNKYTITEEGKQALEDQLNWKLKYTSDELMEEPRLHYSETIRSDSSICG